MRKGTPIAPALALAAAGYVLGCALGCGGGGGPVDPAIVTITIPDGNVAAPTFPLDISVTGCDVKKLELYDRGTFVQNVAFAGNPMRLELNPTQLKFHRFAEGLNLTANLTCTDGRTAQSLAAAGNFWPVKEVTTGNLPRTFVAEGYGVGVTFIGCVSGAGGVRSLVKMDRYGNILGTAQVPGCSDNAIITDRHPITKKRWLWDPPTRSSPGKWSGAAAFLPATMTVTATYLGSAQGTAQVSALGVGPDGDAVIWDNAQLGSMLRRIGHAGGANEAPKWSQNLPAALNAVPVVDASQSVVVPGWRFQSVQSGMMYVERYNYNAPGTLSAHNDLIATSYDITQGSGAPPVQLNAAGTLMYFPSQLPSGQSVVYACSTTVPDCAFSYSPAFKWQSPLIPGSIAVAWPIAKFSRIAAVTSRATYFLNADTGQQVGSPTNGVVTAGGQMITLAFQPGLGREFYQLNGPNLAGAEPLELVGMESPESGELYRYSMSSGGLTAAVDDSGEVWFRLGGKVVRPYPLSEYRMALLP